MLEAPHRDSVATVTERHYRTSDEIRAQPRLRASELCTSLLAYAGQHLS